MGFLDKIYNQSPVFFQNLMCSVKGWQICRRRYNKGFHYELNRYLYDDVNQEEELRKFIIFTQKVPAYKCILNQKEYEQLQKGEISAFDVLKKFPIIGKNSVKERIEDYNNLHFVGQQMLMRTSGTTGAGIIFPYSVEMENRQWAIWWRYRIRLGITFDTWCGWFGGKAVVPKQNKSVPFWRINKPGRQVMFSTYHLTDVTVSDYYNEIVRRGLSWLHGYPSHIARFAALAIDRGLPPIECVKYVTTGAENVLGNQVVIMQKMFPNAIIRQHYGLNEGVANISQDKDGKWIVDDEFCYVEFIPTEDKNVCRIVGTGFSNEAFILVRYDTGDLATVEYDSNGEVCNIISIDGRSSNAITQPSGHTINEASLSIVLHDFMNISEAQFHQKSDTDVDLWVVKGKKYTTEDEIALRKSLDDAFEPEMNVQIVYVDSVERTKAGKLKIVIVDNK